MLDICNYLASPQLNLPCLPFAYSLLISLPYHIVVLWWELVELLPCKGETARADDVNPFFSEGDLDPDVIKGGNRTTVRASSNISSSDSVGDEPNKFDRTRKCSGSTPPLFIHMNCSIHLPTTGLLSMPVQNLPMCLSRFPSFLIVISWQMLNLFAVYRCFDL